MWGGRIRGQGTYGCVFQPALLCRNSKIKDLDSKKVGKITSLEDGINEISIAKYLRTISEYENYVVIPESETCTPEKEQNEKDINQCRFTKKTALDTTIQIIMPWGGNPLSRINLSPKLFNYFRFIEEILSVGAFLVLHNVCHFDIWGQNFLFNSSNTPKLIDFGFAFRPDIITDKDLDMRWRLIAADHDTETPEVTLMLGKLKDIPPSRLCKEMMHSKPAVHRLAVLCDVLPSEWAKDILAWSQASQSFQQNDFLTCWKLYWPGFDAWSIGALLLEVLETQLSVPLFIQSEEWISKGETIKAVLRGICKGHPAQRLDAVEALHLLTNGSNPLISAGSVGEEWVLQKQEKRPPV